MQCTSRGSSPCWSSVQPAVQGPLSSWQQQACGLWSPGQGGLASGASLPGSALTCASLRRGRGAGRLQPFPAGLRLRLRGGVCRGLRVSCVGLGGRCWRLGVSSCAHLEAPCGCGGTPSGLGRDVLPDRPWVPRCGRPVASSCFYLQGPRSLWRPA